jgi:outer membrane lipoprotein-sorting protein
MRVLTVLCAFLGLSMTATAQLRDFDCAEGASISRPDASAILQRVQKNYDEVRTFRANFEQEDYSEVVAEAEQSRGTVLYARPGKMRWDYEKPEQTFLFKDSTSWLYRPGEKMVWIEDVHEVLLSDLPLGWIMGVGKIAKDFALESACTSPAGKVLRLKPNKPERAARDKDGDSATQELAGFTLLVDATSEQPRGARIEHVGGNVTAVVFRDMTINPSHNPLRDTDFNPRFPAGIDVVDHRGSRPVSGVPAERK